MNVSAIDPALLEAAALAPSPAAAPGMSSASDPVKTFSAWLDGQVKATNTDIIAADDAVRRMAVGEPVNLHQVMVNLERAKLQFELVMQVRNKLLDAYQDLMKMQI
jgi:flagellar hook-basal body complex protein FliE